MKFPAKSRVRRRRLLRDLRQVLHVPAKLSSLPRANTAAGGATASRRGKPFTTAFAAGKAAQRSLCQSLARQLGPEGIHVALTIIALLVGIALATDLVHAPLNPGFQSLNLAQAVLLCCWEWRKAELRAAAGAAECLVAGPEPAAQKCAEGSGEEAKRERMAPAGELYNFFEHLEQQLDDANFFRVPEKRPGMVRNLRNFFARARPSRDELRTLHGVVAVLAGRRKDGTPVRRSAGS